MFADIRQKLVDRTLCKMRGPFIDVQRKVMVTRELSLRPRPLNVHWIPLNQTKRYYTQQEEFKKTIPCRPKNIYYL